MNAENSKALKEMLESYKENPVAGGLEDLLLISIATSLAVIADAMAESENTTPVYSDTDSIKMRSLTIKEKEKFKASLNKAFGNAAMEPCKDENLISIQRLNKIRNYIVINIMRNPDIMFSDIRDNDVDPIEVIASLYEILHRMITGEPYNYMFHWANKCGSWVKDDLFTSENPENRS